MRKDFLKEAFWLRKINEVKQKHLANRSGLSTSYINAVFAGTQGVKLENLGKFLDGMKLKIVEEDAIVIDKKSYDALLVLANQATEMMMESSAKSSEEDFE